MSTEKILRFFRDQEPAFLDEPDDKLINFIGSTEKEFLQDEEFKRDFQNVLRGKMQRLQTPEGRQQVAIEAGIEDLTTTEKAISSFQAGAKMLASNLALAGSRAAERAKQSSFGGFLARTPGIGDLLDVVTIEAPEAVAETMAGQAEQIRETRDVLPPTTLQFVIDTVAEAAPSIGPALVAGPVGGLPATVGAAAITSYGAVLSDAEQELRDRGYSESDVRRFANAEAVVAGLATGLVTGGFNKFAPGVEKLAVNAFRNPATVVTQSGQTAGQFTKFVVDTLKGFGSEASEESLDETAQSLLEMYVRNPEMSALEVAKRAGVAGLGGGFLGAGSAMVTSLTTPTTTPQTDAAVQEAGPIPVAREEADVIKGARTEEEILATAPELPAVEQQQLGLEPTPVATEAAEVIEGDRPLEEVLATAPELPTAPAIEEQAPQQFKLFPEMDEAQRSVSEKANTTIQEAQQLTLELEGLTNEVNELQTQAEAEPTAEATAALESKQQELETKRQQVETKRQEATEAALEASEQEVVSNIEAEQQSPFEVDPETDPVAERAGFATSGIVDPSLRPFLNYKDGKIGWTVEGLFNLGEKVRQKLFGGKPSSEASRVANLINTQSSGLKNSVSTLIKAFESNLSSVFKDSNGRIIPSEQRDIAPIDALLRDRNAIKNVDFNSFAKRLFAHRGATYELTESDKQLARQTLEYTDQARKMIDFLSQKMIDSGLVAEENLPTFEQGVGEYLTRSYKVFNKAYDWNWDTIPRPIREAAVKDIMSSVNSKRSDNPITEQEATDIARELTTDRDKAFEWSMGLTAVGGVPVRLLYKRKQLSKPMRELLGEIKDPVANTLLTLDKQINLLMGFQMQNQLAEVLVESGLASHERDVSKGFTEQIFQNNFALNIQSKRKYPSLRPLYTTKANAEELNSFFQRNNTRKELDFIKRSLKKLAGIVKYNLVILNPHAYSTQYINAVWNEVTQGRLLWPNYAAGLGLMDANKVNFKALSLLVRNRKLRKIGKNLPTLEDQDRVLGLKGSDLLKDPAKFIQDNSILLEDLAYRYGALNDQVDLRYINDLMMNQREIDLLKDLTAQRMWQEMGRRLDKNTIKQLSPLKGAKALNRGAVKIYGGGDAAGKMNAFLVEAIGEASQNPESSLADIMVMAAKKAAATTPSPATISPAIKEASNLSLLNAFISWQIELLRNRYNQAAIAAKELTSENSIEKSRGTRRAVSGAIGIASAVAAGRQILEALMGWIGSNDEEYTPEAGDWVIKNLLPPWDTDQSVAIVKFDSNGFAYTPLSYVMPDSVYAAPFKAGMRGESFWDSIENITSSIQQTIGGLHPMAQALSILLFNYDPSRSRNVANTELPTSEQLAKRVAESYWTVAPRIDKLLRKKLPTILSDEKKSFGREYSVDEELLSFIGVRTTGYEWEGALRGQMQNFERRLREAKRIVPKRDIDELIAADKPEEAKALQDKEDARVQAIAKEYSDLYVGALKHVPGLTRKQLDKWQKNITDTVGGARLSSDLTTPAAQAAKAAGY